MLGVRKWGNDGHCMRLGGWLVQTRTQRRNPPWRDDRPHSCYRRRRRRWGDCPRRWWSWHAMHAGSQACRHMLSFSVRIWFQLEIWKKPTTHPICSSICLSKNFQSPHQFWESGPYPMRAFSTRLPLLF